MVDIETLDTRASAVIVSIGAVQFDPNSRLTGLSFYVRLDMDAQLKAGRTVSDSAISWWAQQLNLARNVFCEPVTPAVEGLRAFNAFVADAEGVWGNGSDFDNAILASANDTFGLKGWSYRRNRCYRTLKQLAANRNLPGLTRQGVRHNALEDAYYQAQRLQAIVANLKLDI